MISSENLLRAESIVLVETADDVKSLPFTSHHKLAYLRYSRLPDEQCGRDSPCHGSCSRSEVTDDPEAKSGTRQSGNGSETRHKFRQTAKMRPTVLTTCDTAEYPDRPLEMLNMAQSG